MARVTLPDDRADARPQSRIEGFAPIGEYAAIGDGRTVALVAADGAIDWMTMPTIASPTVFAALLDPDRGGRFALAPAVPARSSRRYLAGTNVLETEFVTEHGRVRVTDWLATQDGSLLPWLELCRRIEGVSGSVPMRWHLEPRFEYGADGGMPQERGGVPMFVHHRHQLAILSLDAGEPQLAEGAVEGAFEATEGTDALLALIGVDNEPIPIPPREEIEVRLEGTIGGWRRWASGMNYTGEWSDAVSRSALALKLLVYAPTGAIAAAPTTSLPEQLGGERNFDYRFSWVRDTSFSLDAFDNLGFRESLHGSLSWLLSASARTHPRLGVFYGIDGSVPEGQSELGLRGYRGSSPVRLGNGASGQLQLGAYGDFFGTVWQYVHNGNMLDPSTGTRLAEVADALTGIWRHPDSGIWELQGEERQYTSSKVGCWVAFDRAARLAEQGEIPAAGAARWRAEAEAVARFLEERCWWPERGAYRMAAGMEALDASVLLMARMGYGDPAGARMKGTIDAVAEELDAGWPLLYRYTGMAAEEGAFVACSFWLVEALALAGRRDEAVRRMKAMLETANDVGLLSEEIDPGSRELLGNFPQGLSHLALVNAAAILETTRSGT
jgi:GH15 family glucan-1,4-alpha-glucosidase